MYIDHDTLNTLGDPDCKLFLEPAYHIARYGMDDMRFRGEVAEAVAGTLTTRRVQTSFKVKQSHIWNNYSFIEYKENRKFMFVLYCCPLGKCVPENLARSRHPDSSGADCFCFDMSYGLKTPSKIYVLRDDFVGLCKMLRDFGEYDKVVDFLDTEFEKLKLLRG